MESFTNRFDQLRAYENHGQEKYELSRLKNNHLAFSVEPVRSQLARPAPVIQAVTLDHRNQDESREQIYQQDKREATPGAPNPFPGGKRFKNQEERFNHAPEVLSARKHADNYFPFYSPRGACLTRRDESGSWHLGQAHTAGDLFAICRWPAWLSGVVSAPHQTKRADAKGDSPIGCANPKGKRNHEAITGFARCAALRSQGHRKACPRERVCQTGRNGDTIRGKEYE